MNYVSLNEAQREEIITKCKESLRYRLNELETSYQEKEQQYTKLMDDYMNEKNLRVTAETAAKEAGTKMEEMQKTIDDYQEKIVELEGELAQHLEDMNNEEEEDSEDGEECFDDEELNEMKTKYTLLEERALELQDRVVELEEVLQKNVKEHIEYTNDSSKEKQWLSSLLEKERQINEKLSNESDLQTAELQKQLKDITEKNIALSKWKNENENNGRLLQDLTENHRITVNKLEIDKLHLHKELQKTREELHILQNATRNSGSPEEGRDSKDQTECDGPSGASAEQMEEENSDEEIPKQDKKAGRYGNLGYRAKLSKMIQNGMHKIRKNK